MTPDPLASHRDAVYSLDELVAAANALLPAFLPKDATGRAAEGVTPRLVRFYATESLLPEAHKEGREARYSFGHLVALLAVRRLLADGFGSAAIRRALAGRSRDELEALLRDEVQLQLVPTVTSSAADLAKAEFLRSVRARAGLDGAPAQPLSRGAAPGMPASPATPAPAPRTPGVSKAPTPTRHAPDTSQARSQNVPPPPSAAKAPATPAPATPTPAAPTSAVPRVTPYQAYRSSVSPLSPTTWTRVTIQDGLELMVRDDFTLPTTLLGDQELLQLIKVVLLQVEQVSRKRK